MRLLPAIFLTAILAIADSTLAGSYTGTYSGASGSDGAISLTLKPGKDGAWEGTAGFTLGGQDVKCKTINLKVDGNQLEMTYEFDLQGTALRSTITGIRKGDTMEGTYVTRTTDGGGVDEGTWKASPAK